MVIFSIAQCVQAMRGMSIGKEALEVLDVAEVVRAVQRECARPDEPSIFFWALVGLFHL